MTDNYYFRTVFVNVNMYQKPRVMGSNLKVFKTNMNPVVQYIILNTFVNRIHYFAAIISLIPPPVSKWWLQMFKSFTFDCFRLFANSKSF